MEAKEIQNRMLREQFLMLKNRGVPDTDPRVKALKRSIAAQKIALPREGKDFPPGLKFKAKRKQHGLS